MLKTARKLFGFPVLFASLCPILVSAQSAAIQAPWTNTAENPYWCNVLKPLMDMDQGMAFVDYPSRFDDYIAKSGWVTWVWKKGQQFHERFPDNPNWREWLIWQVSHRPSFFTAVTPASIEESAVSYRVPLAQRYDSAEHPIDETAKAEYERKFASFREGFMAEATPEEKAALLIAEIQVEDGAFTWGRRGLLPKATRSSATERERDEARRELDSLRHALRRRVLEVARMDGLDSGEAADIEEELLTMIKTMKGIAG